MSRCPITYEEITPDERYSLEGLKRLSKRLKGLKPLPYSAEEQRQEAAIRATKMSVQGVQPKLSSVLNIANEAFEIVDTGGEYILKPQNDYPEVPENEDLTMRLADLVGVEIPLHGLLYSKDSSLTYFIKRFDREGAKRKIAVEDFAQISNETRDTKYRSSMEQVATVISKHCTFPVFERVKLFRLTLFNFLIGNEDMHLKNFSLIRRDGKIELSPAYDLLNTTIALRNVKEEIALPLGGKKGKLSRSLLVNYFGTDRLGLTKVTMDDTLSVMESALSQWEELIQKSFLSPTMKEKYHDLLSSRWERVFS